MSPASPTHRAQDPAASTDRPAGDRWPGGAGLVALAALTAGALGLRLAGLDHLLPQRNEPDPDLAYQVKALVEHGGWSPGARGGSHDAYPTFIARVASLGLDPRVPGSAERPAGLGEHLAAASAYLVRTRLVVCLFAAALIPAAFLLARRFLGDSGAWIAALLVALDPLHLLFSAQARPHGVIATLALVAVLAAMELRRRPSRRAYLIAGLAVGLALGALHSGVVLLLPLFYAHLSRERGAGPAPGRRILWALVPVAVCFAYFYRAILAATLAAGSRVLRQDMVLVGPHQLSPKAFDGGGFEALARIVLATNPVLGALAAAGLAALALRALRRRDRGVLAGDAGVALAYALPYFLVLGLYRHTEERFTLPLLPYMALLAAWVLLGSAGALRAFLGRRAAPLALAGPAAVALALPAATSAKIAWLRTQPDTYTQAAALLTEVPGGERAMLAPGLDLPLFYAREALFFEDGRPRAFTIWARYQRALPPEVRTGKEHPFEVLTFFPGDPTYTSAELVGDMLRAKEPPYVVLEVSGYLHARAEGSNLLAGVEEWGTLAWRFLAHDVDDADYRRLDYVPRGRFLPRVFSAGALGPELRVYRRRERRSHRRPQRDPAPRPPRPPRKARKPVAQPEAAPASSGLGAPIWIGSTTLWVEPDVSRPARV